MTVDLRLPRLSGEEVLARLRARRPDVPVIILTARDAVEDRVRNLNAGADDDVPKPFSFAELPARVHARLRFRDQRTSTELDVGGVQLDLRTRTARLDGRESELTSRELALLETLLFGGVLLGLSLWRSLSPLEELARTGSRRRS